MKRWNQTGTVVEIRPDYKSYFVETENGQRILRNRIFLKKISAVKTPTRLEVNPSAQDDELKPVIKGSTVNTLSQQPTCLRAKGISG